MSTLAFFEGPYREELPDGTLVYLGEDGEVLYAGPRLRPDLPLTVDEEPGRWWRVWPLPSNIEMIIQSGYSVAEAADYSGVPVDVAQRIADAGLSGVVVLTTLSEASSSASQT
jgi:hypothetical protein